MATQIIRCPADLLQELWEGHASRPANSRSVISLEPLTNDRRCRAIMVAVDDPRLTWDDWPWHGHQVFVVLLTSDPQPDDRFAPRPLPDDMVAPIIDALAEQTGAYLTGHAWMDLATLLERAKTMPNDLPLAQVRRAPRSRFERKLVEAAVRLQKRWSPELKSLQANIAAYGADLLRSNVGALVDSLSTEGGVVDLMNLETGDRPGLWRIGSKDPGLCQALMKEIDKAKRIRNTGWWVASELCPYSVVPRSPLSSFHVRELYRGGFAHPGTDYDAPLWRREGFKGCEFPVRVPAAGIEAALSRFVAAFDRQLFASIDPIITAALAMFHLCRIEPVGRRDRDAALLLFYTLLREAGLPPMPVLLLGYERYWELANVMVESLDQDRPDGLVEIMIDVVRMAQATGVGMAEQLSRERQTLLGSLRNGGFPTDGAERAVRTLLSTPMVRIWSCPELAPPEEADLRPYADHLHKDDLIDIIEAGHRRWWSSPFARDLASTRSAA